MSEESSLPCESSEDGAGWQSFFNQVMDADLDEDEVDDFLLTHDVVSLIPTEIPDRVLT